MERIRSERLAVMRGDIYDAIVDIEALLKQQKALTEIVASLFIQNKAATLGLTGEAAWNAVTNAYVLTLLYVAAPPNDRQLVRIAINAVAQTMVTPDTRVHRIFDIAKEAIDSGAWKELSQEDHKVLGSVARDSMNPTNQLDWVQNRTAVLVANLAMNYETATAEWLVEQLGTLISGAVIVIANRRFEVTDPRKAIVHLAANKVVCDAIRKELPFNDLVVLHKLAGKQPS